MPKPSLSVRNTLRPAEIMPPTNIVMKMTDTAVNSASRLDKGTH